MSNNASKVRSKRPRFRARRRLAQNRQKKKNQQQNHSQVKQDDNDTKYKWVRRSNNEMSNKKYKDNQREPQHKLLVYGYIRAECKQQNMCNTEQLIHEFYHKNVIVYQTQKDNPSIEEFTGLTVGGHGGRKHEYISWDHRLLTTLRIADLTLYNQDGISIQGYKFEGDRFMQHCNMGHPPDGLRNTRNIELVKRDNEYCNGVEIYYGGEHDGIRGIRFRTNYERVIMVGKDTRYGMVKWKKTELKLPHKQYGIIGFQGRSGWLLDQICFVFAPQ